MSTQQQISLADFDAVIFDMDGTMVNNAPYHKKAWLEFLNKHKIELTSEEYKEKVSGRKNDKILENVFNKKFEPNEVTSFAEEKEAMYRELYKNDIKEVPGLTDIIKILKSHQKRLAIATTAPEKNRTFGLEALGLTDAFSVIVGDEHVLQSKPHPEVYLKAANMLGVPPERCLVFEDTPSGVGAGKNAHMTVVAVMTSHPQEDLEKADYIVSDFTAVSFV